MSNEENILEYVFHSMGRFAFDRSKELCDKEKDVVKNPQGFALVWSQFLVTLSQLSTAEKGYMSLGFLSQTPNNPKAFRKKEVPLQALYGQIKQDLDKKAEVFHRSPFSSSDSFPSSIHSTSAGIKPTIPTVSVAVLEHLSAQLGHFAAARLDMIEVYEELHEMGLNRTTTHHNLIPKLDQVLNEYGKKFYHPVLAALETSFTYETEILKHLIDAQLRIFDWNFMAALCHLNHAHRRLTVWPSVIQAPEPVLIGLKMSPQKNAAMPALYTWFIRYHAALLAKFSLYFHDVLQKQTSLTDFKSFLAKCNPDYYQKILAFSRKHDAHSVSLVFDGNGSGFRGLGYHLPTDVVEQSTGLNSYPAIFCYPTERPSKHWPSVVMILLNEAERLAQPGTIIPVYDKSMERTYFVAHVEEKLNFNVGQDSKTVKNQLKNALRRGVVSNLLRQSNGSGASGSFPVNVEAKAAKSKSKSGDKMNEDAKMEEVTKDHVILQNSARIILSIAEDTRYRPLETIVTGGIILLADMSSEPEDFIENVAASVPKYDGDEQDWARRCKGQSAGAV